jgi:hypothetical protein
MERSGNGYEYPIGLVCMAARFNGDFGRDREYIFGSDKTA